MNREDIEIGSQIEVYVKPGRKDVIGWRRNCTVISMDSEGNVDYRWQGHPRTLLEVPLKILESSFFQVLTVV